MERSLTANAEGGCGWGGDLRPPALGFCFGFQVKTRRQMRMEAMTPTASAKRPAGMACRVRWILMAPK
ncbi:MAG: hypothetical protein RI897_171 [Verrucomicrobiota bacterium]